MRREGNPLFVVETVRAGSGSEAQPGDEAQGSYGIPPRAHAVIAGRLAQLSDPAREIAAAAARDRARLRPATSSGAW